MIATSPVMATLRTEPVHVLVVDDEAGVRAALRTGLEAEGWQVSEAASKAGLLGRLEAADIVTLDLGLADEDGLEVAREVRARRNVPIVMITARATPIDRLTGLEHGADDYIVKPFLVREVVMRIRAVLRRYELERREQTDGDRDGEVGMTEGGTRFTFETGVLDTARRQCSDRSGHEIALTDAELDLLALLLRHPARVLSRDEIMAALKGKSWSPLDRTIDGHVARLRKKIEPDPEQPRLVKSVRGVGYVFTGDVERG